MASRKPLVLVSGKISQLPVGDTLDASSAEVDVVSATNKEASPVVIGTAAYIYGAGQIKKAKADAVGTSEVLGLVKSASIDADAAGFVQTNGVLAATTAQWDAVTGETGGLTAGAWYYLSKTAGGNLTQTAPSATGEFVVKVGRALSTTEMVINPEPAIAL